MYPAWAFSVPQNQELVSGEEDATRQALSAAGRKRTAHQRRLSKSFLFLSSFFCLFLMEAGWKCFALRRKNVFIKHSAWAKIKPVLAVKVTFTLVISSADWICFPHLPVGSLSFLHTLTILPNLVSWGSLGAFSICILGPYIILNGPAAYGRSGFPCLC